MDTSENWVMGRIATQDRERHRDITKIFLNRREAIGTLKWEDNLNGNFEKLVETQCELVWWLQYGEDGRQSVDVAVKVFYRWD